jgi:DNA repair protein RadC
MTAAVAIDQNRDETPVPTPEQARRSRTRRLGCLRLVRECSFEAPPDYPPSAKRVQNPKDVFERMKPYAEREVVEVFWVLCLDSQHRVIGNAPHAISRGILNSSLVHPREVFVHAIVARAAAIVLCHNHPSGDPAPSKDDEEVTKQLIEAGQVLDLPVLDHIIVGRDRYTSFMEAGLL